MKRAFVLVLHPLHGADLISANPAWIGQCVLLLGIGLFIHIGSYGRIVQLTIDHLPASATQADREAMSGILGEQLWVSAALFPFKMLAGFGGTALLLYSAIRAMASGGVVHFREIFALEMYAETVLLLGKVTASVAALMGAGRNPYTNPFGIDQLFPGTFDEITTANWINPFTLWYFALLAFGIARMGRMSYRKATAVALCASVFIAVMQESSFYLLRNFFHF